MSNVLTDSVSVATGFSPSVRQAVRHAARLAAVDAEQADRESRLSIRTAAAVSAAGLPGYFVPQRWGGRDGSFAGLFADAAALGEGCSSAAWCGALWATHGRYAAHLPEEGQWELWGDSPDVRIAAALTPPSGVAMPEGSGWRLHGTWHFVSGVDFADWVLLAAPEPGQDGGRIRVLLVPAEQVTVLDTWDSTGMRGTGSHTAVVKDAFVPRHRSFLMDELLLIEGAGERGERYAVPAHLAGGTTFCAAALGAARRALELWSRWAGSKATGSGRSNHESAAVRETLATASAHIDAAELLLTRAAYRADTELVTPLLVAGNQRDAAVAVDLLVGAVDRMLRIGGAHIRGAGDELQRRWRDVHTVAAHRVLRLELVAEAYATAALGARQDP